MSYYFTENDENKLSNWYPVILTVRGVSYRSVEHLYQTFRFLPRIPTINEEKYAYLIRNAETPEEAKYLGNHPPTVKGMEEVREREDWKEIREDVMLECLRAKFNQCPECREALLDVQGDIHLQNEAKSNEDGEDFYWGTGFDDLGKDRLGALLMIVQKELELNYPLLTPRSNHASRLPEEGNEFFTEGDERWERLWRETLF